jgi:hypothetical protein
VLDAGSAPSVPAPRTVAHDADAAKPGRDELGNASVGTVGEDAAVLSAQGFDGGASVVHGVVAIARTACGYGDDMEVAPASEDLGVA